MTDNIHSHAASPMLRALAEIAYDAGAIILRHYADEIVARRKDDESPVTAADEEAGTIHSEAPCPSGARACR